MRFLLHPVGEMLQIDFVAILGPAPNAWLRMAWSSFGLYAVNGDMLKVTVYPTYAHSPVGF